MSKVTYLDKEDLILTEIEAKYKISAEDMNSLKNSINNLYNAVGYEFHEDTGASSIVVNSSTDTQLVIGNSGQNTNVQFKPQELGVNEFMWDGEKIVAKRNGDLFYTLLAMDIVAKSGNPTSITFNLDALGATPPNGLIPFRTEPYDGTVPRTISFAIPFFASPQVVDNGLRMFMRVNSGSITLQKRSILIYRAYTVI